MVEWAGRQFGVRNVECGVGREEAQEVQRGKGAREQESARAGGGGGAGKRAEE